MLVVLEDIFGLEKTILWENNWKSFWFFLEKEVVRNKSSTDFHGSLQIIRLRCRIFIRKEVIIDTDHYTKGCDLFSDIMAEKNWHTWKYSDFKVLLKTLKDLCFLHENLFYQFKTIHTDPYPHQGNFLLLIKSL